VKCRGPLLVTRHSRRRFSENQRFSGLRLLRARAFLRCSLKRPLVRAPAGDAVPPFQPNLSCGRVRGEGKIVENAPLSLALFARPAPVADGAVTARRSRADGGRRQGEGETRRTRQRASPPTSPLFVGAATAASAASLCLRSPCLPLSLSPCLAPLRGRGRSRAQRLAQLVQRSAELLQLAPQFVVFVFQIGSGGFQCRQAAQ